MGTTRSFFGNIVRMDGFSVDFLFYKRQQGGNKDSYKNLDLSLDDFSLPEVRNTYSPITLNPGREFVFTAVIGPESNRQVRRCTASEYYHMTGSTKYSKKLNEKKIAAGIALNESQTPLPKTPSHGPETATDRLHCTKEDKELQFKWPTCLLTGQPSKRSKAKKRKKRRRKKGKGKKADRPPSKSKKWRPARFQEATKQVPLVVSGAGMFGKDANKMKGHRCGVSGKLYQTLKRREAEDSLIVVTIDEFKTSKTCSLCFFDDMDIINAPEFKGTGVLHCKQCRKLWQRDVNAANNMSIISKAVWSGEGRPNVFKPPKKKQASP